MAEGFDRAALLNYMPPEILRNIFIYLPAKALIRCREVNAMWKAVVDSLSREEYMWQENCQVDFPTIYEEARMKAKPGLLWYNLYRSLSLWKMFPKAAEEREEFCNNHSDKNEIRNFKILEHGIIGVLKKNSIAYYDIETLELSQRQALTGEFSKYTETKNLVVVLTFNLHLNVIRKIVSNINRETAATFENVTTFILAGNELYYVTLCDEIFVVYLNYSKFKANYLMRSNRPIMTISHSEGNLNVLTVQREILSVQKQNGHLLMRATLGTGAHLIRQLQRYQFLELMDWRLFFQWTHMWTMTVPILPLRDVLFIKVYGDITFLGCNSGVLNIYHIPIANQEYDIFESTPIKQYNFIEEGDKISSGSCPILNVEIMEGIDGHTIIVAIPKKIIVLNYTHDFETEISPMIIRRIGAESPEFPEIPELAIGARPSGAARDGASTSAAGLYKE